jgi:predicted small lipoprotein YifL
MWFNMRRVIIAFAVLAVFLSLGGCSRKNQAAYAKPVASAPHPTKASSVKPRPLPARKSPKARSPMPSSGSLSASDGADEQEAEVKFKVAQAKAKKVGVHQLTQDDIDGLSLAQIKQLRGY